MFDTIIIGGGASGLASAVMLKKISADLKVAVVEQFDRVGKKISVTGNGRCNISNTNIKKSNYHSNDLNKAFEILKDFDLQKTAEFFSSIGVELAFEGNKAYPRSFQASSVVDALRFAATNLKVDIIAGTTVQKVTKSNNSFILKTNNNTLTAKTVIVATGGLAGGSKLGSNGDGYKFLKSFGHKIIEEKPVIVQVKTENTLTKILKGIKVNAKVSVINSNKTLATDSGEVLFCDYGLSGPPILQLSRYAKKGTEISLDIFSDIEFNNLVDLIMKRKQIFSSLPLTEFFAGLIHKKLGQAILKDADISLNNNADALTKTDCINIAATLKNFRFKVLGNTGFVNAQATSGGADLNDFDDNLMSKKTAGLFATGEVLDVDGDCGGYNLQWAWSSAYRVANAVSCYIQG